MKRCPRCGETKPLADFGRNKAARDGRQGWCRTCQASYLREWKQRSPDAVHAYRAKERTKRRKPREMGECIWCGALFEKVTSTQVLCSKECNSRSHRLRAYGLNGEEFERLKAQQQGRCALCGRRPTGARLDGWHVDHDHETGQIRSLLCGTCNVGLGMFGDDPERLAAAIRYLQRHHQQRLRLV